MKNEELEWRKKSHALWIQARDNNPKLFHNFSNLRINLNSIWEIKNEEGVLVSSFQEKAEAGASFFEALFKDPTGCQIQETLKVVTNLPSILSDEMNQALSAEVMKPKVGATLSSMQSDKSPGPDGFTMDFSKSFYEFLKEDLLEVVKESQRIGRVHGALNSTFLCLIPKKKDVVSFDDFQLISCCNVVYKLLAKIIARRLMLFFSEVIGEEQFGFLPTIRFMMLWPVPRKFSIQS